MRTVADNRSELGDRLGRAIRQKPGSRRSQRVFYERTSDGEQTALRLGKVYDTDRQLVPAGRR